MARYCEALTTCVLPADFMVRKHAAGTNSTNGGPLPFCRWHLEEWIQRNGREPKFWPLGTQEPDK